MLACCFGSLHPWVGAETAAQAITTLWDVLRTGGPRDPAGARLVLHFLKETEETNEAHHAGTCRKARERRHEDELKREKRSRAAIFLSVPPSRQFRQRRHPFL